MTLFLFVAVTALLGLYMAWTIGANDVANSMADAVGSKSVSIRQAVIAAGVCEFAGAVLVGSHVTETVRKGIVDPDALARLPGATESEGAALLVLGMMSALLAAGIWLHVATAFGLPVSTTHSIVGAVAGFGVVAAGWSAVHWGKMGQIVASWFVSPVAGAALGFILFKLISRFILGQERPARAATRYAPYLVFLLVNVVVLAIVYKGLKHFIREQKAEWLTSGGGALLISMSLALCGAFVCRRILRHRLRDCFRAPLARQLERVEQTFRPLVLMTSCTVAFAHGANDVANAVGPLAAVVDIMQSGRVARAVPVPIWVLNRGKEDHDHHALARCRRRPLRTDHGPRLQQDGVARQHHAHARGRYSGRRAGARPGGGQQAGHAQHLRLVAHHGPRRRGPGHRVLRRWAGAALEGHRRTHSGPLNPSPRGGRSARQAPSRAAT